MPTIGLLNEKPLHASLKKWFARPGDQVEVMVDRYVIDIVQDRLLLEIQTSSFASIKSKLKDLLPKHQIRLIYPITQEKWIIKRMTNNKGQPTRRKSPKRGRLEDVFWQMVSFPELILHPNFSLEIVLTREEEVRRLDGKRHWRRRGWIIEERRLLEVVDQRLFEEPADWRALLPETINDPFSTKDLAETIGLGRPLAQKMAYCLCKAKVIRLKGKQGRANLYELAGA